MANGKTYEIFKLILKILWRLAVLAAVIVFAAILLIQTPGVQTWLARKVTEKISEQNMDAAISLGRIHLKPFNTLVLKDVAVTDKNPVRINPEEASPVLKKKMDRIGWETVDTLMKAKHIIVRFSFEGLLSNEGVKIKSARIDDGFFFLTSEENIYGTNLGRMFGLIPNPDKPDPKDVEVFSIKDIELNNFAFMMKNFQDRKDGEGPEYREGIDWEDLEVTDIYFKGGDMRLRGKVMWGVCESLSFKEKSGYVCECISGKTRVGNGMTLVEDLHIKDPWTDIRLDSFSMSYDHQKAFSEFIWKVRLDGDIKGGTISFGTLKYFAPGMSDNDLALELSGKVSGPVCDLRVSGLDFRTPDGSFGGKVSGKISGIPDLDMVLNFDITGLNFTMKSLDRFVSCWVPGKNTLGLKDLAPGMKLRMTGKTRGSLNNLGVTAEIKTSHGTASVDGYLKDVVSRKRPTIIGGKLATRNLRLDKLIRGVPVEEVSLRAGLEGQFPKDGSQMNARIDSLKIGRLKFNSYDYSGIAAAGKMNGTSFDGKVVCNDPNLNFLLQGIFALSQKSGNGLYKFYGNVGYADLNALNIDKRDISKVRFSTEADFTKFKSSDILGNISVNSLVLENSLGSHNIGNIKVSSRSGAGGTQIKFTSGFAEASYTGSGAAIDFIRDLEAVTVSQEIPDIYDGNKAAWDGDTHSFIFKALDTYGILAFALPGLYVSEGTTIKMDIGKDGIMKASMDSKMLAFKEQYAKDVSMGIDNSDKRLKLGLNCSTLKAGGFFLENNILDLRVDDNVMDMGFSYNSSGGGNGMLEGYAVADRDDDNRLFWEFGLRPSELNASGMEWNIMPSKLFLKNGDLSVEGFEVRGEDQRLTINGGYRQSEADTLRLGLENFDMTVLNPLLGKMSIGGRMSGDVTLASPKEDMALLADIRCDSTSFCGTDLGNIRAGSYWNDDLRRFEIFLSNEIDGRRSINAAGGYSPGLKRLDMGVELDRFDLGIAAPFLTDIFSETEGTVSGRLMAEGPIDALSIRSEATRIDGALRLGITNVRYDVSGPFNIDEDGVHLDDIRILDRKGNKGQVAGLIGWSGLKDIKFDLGINITDIEAIDIEEKSADIFYGNLAASGNIRIKGPVNALNLDIDASTSGDGQFHIPITASATSGTGNLLTFKNYDIPVEIDPYERMIKRIRQKEAEASELNLNLKVAVNPQIQAFIEIDKASGNVLSGRGNGNIEIELKPKNEVFNMRGDYTLTGGSYRFVALGLAVRDFAIKDGSTIKFNGDIMDSSLDIDAVYKTKVSLSTLIADTSSVSTRRTVECGIKISDKLSNPRLGFSINIPDIDPLIKTKVESALSTEDKVQKQFLSLIISNSFLPDEQSGIFNNTTILYSNVTEMMANQLNNIFQKLDIPLDLGLNYQPNDKGTDIFDVAVSTQLFNNRVIVNGNIGNRQYSGSTKSEVVGDIDIEIKLDRAGSFRLNLFSHSADQYSNYLDNSQRNGVGLTFQKEFNTLGELFRDIFTGKKKKKRQSAEYIAVPVEMTTIRISGND
ncbi:MAG: translocation/assembly module TamB domain-containing protein [Candidatus Cryptobacteroides sp.]